MSLQGNRDSKSGVNPKLKSKTSISFRVNLTLIFTFLILATSLSITFYNYYQSSKTVVDLTDEIISKATKQVITETISFLEPADISARLSAQSVNSSNYFGSKDYTLDYMWRLLRVHEQIAFIYIGDKDGNFVQVRRTPELATRVIDRTTKDPTETWLLRDKDYKVTNMKIGDASYDHRVRGWYNDTSNQFKAHWTDMYIFSSIKKPGITVSYPLLDKENNQFGVMAADITLNKLSSFLQNQVIGKTGIVFIVNEKDELIAFPNPNLAIINGTERARAARVDELSLKPGSNSYSYKISEVSLEAIKDCYSKHSSTGENKIESYTNGEKYLGRFTPFPETFGKKWKIAVVLPEKEIISSVRDLTKRNIVISIFIVVISLIVILFIVKSVSNPIINLAKATKRLKGLYLDVDIPTNSRISEISLMQNAMVALRNGLISFERYVPSDIVRTLMRSGQKAELTAEERNLTIFFSDIEGFSAISKRISPEQLVSHFSQYLDELTKIIMDQKGTIDKYIGDSIMAFWGAPTHLSNSAELACRAAILSQKELTKLNSIWADSGKEVMVTRIGIHTGDTTVGNFGSNERMNYTLIGDSVNLASRIEGINKLFNTKIIITEDTFNQLSNGFICRSLGYVELKGGEYNLKVYELVGEKGDPDISEEDIYFCEKYSSAIELFYSKNYEEANSIVKELKVINPDDLGLKRLSQDCDIKLKL